MTRKTSVRIVLRHPARIQVDDEIDLRILREEDASELFALTDGNREYLRRWLPWVDATKAVEDTLRFIREAGEQLRRNDGFQAGIGYREQLVGVAGYHYWNWANRKTEIGYWLAERFQGMGIMTRACGALVAYAFDKLGLHRVEIRAAAGNVRSRAIPERLGFVQEGVLRQAEWTLGGPEDQVVYGLLRKDWEAARKEARRSLYNPVLRSRPRGSDSIRIALFGAGAVGSVAASHLVRLKEIDELVLAEQFPERAEALASRLRSRKTRVVPVRAFDPGSLAKILKGADLAINAAHASLDLSLMEACLDAGASYMDLSSLPSRQFPLDARFRKAGLTALLGGGEDPGLGNVLARVAVDALDTVDTIKIRDGDTASSPDTPLPVVWSPETFLEEVFSPGLYFEDGKIVKVPPWSGREVYPFPEPVGPQPVYWMDHEEPETLGKFIGKGLKFADLKLAIDDALFHTLNLLRQLGVLGDAAVEVDGTKVSPRKVLMRLLPRPTDLIGKVTGTAMILVEVEGWKDGERVVHRLYTGLKHEEAFARYGATATGYLVGTGAAIFATQFARGQIRQTGVIAPECLEPAQSLRLMAAMGLPVVHETRVARALN